MAILVLAVFSLVAWASNLEKGLAAGVTFGVFAAIVQTKWASRGDWRFWAIIALFATIHVLVIFIVRFPEARAGLVSLPVALVDGFIMWGLINWVEKHFPCVRKLNIRGQRS
jgi:hypothetical protein